MQVAKPELVYGLAMGGQTDSQVGLQVTESWVTSYAYTYYMQSTYVNLHWVAKWWNICIDLHTTLSSTKVNTLVHKQVANKTKAEHKLINL